MGKGSRVGKEKGLGSLSLQLFVAVVLTALVALAALATLAVLVDCC